MKRVRRAAVVAAGAVALAACQLISGVDGLGVVGDTGDAASDAAADTTTDTTTTPDATPDVAPDSPRADASDADADAAARDGAGDADAPATLQDGGCFGPADCITGTCSDAGRCVDPPSCRGMDAGCGVNATESCCTSITVDPGDAGAFLRGYDGVFYDAGAAATLSGDFRVDKFEVTVGRFKKYVAAFQLNDHPPTGGGAYRGVAGSGWDSAWDPGFPAAGQDIVTNITSGGSCFNPTYNGGNDALPVTCVDWYLAFAFCIWDGGRLPTETEWDFIASGGAQQRVYPWSSPPNNISIGSDFAAYNCAGANTVDAGACMNPNSIAPVGTHPRGNGRFGHADLGGNVWETVFDWYSSPMLTPCTNCVQLDASSARRVWMSGGYFNNPDSLQSAHRDLVDPTFNYGALGVRCAR